MRSWRSPRCEVAVRFVRTEVFDEPALASRAREVLGVAEREALARLRPPAARRDYLAAHALARTMLGEIAGCDPARVRLRSSPRGRPEFVPPPGAPPLHFSLSHADGVALCAVAKGCPVGADVESLRNVGPDALGVAEAVCSRRERDALRALPPPARDERLLSIWTRKEAFAKAIGFGFYFPLPEIGLHDETDGQPDVQLVNGSTPGAPLVRLASWRLAPHHLAAVAVLAQRSFPCRGAPVTAVPTTETG